MPIYEYQCNACGQQFELLQKLSDPVIKKCPECGKNKLEKLVSASGFQLKGTGWYVTDFKDKPKSDSKKESKESVATPTTDKKTSETKNCQSKQD